MSEMNRVVIEWRLGAAFRVAMVLALLGCGEGSTGEPGSAGGGAAYADCSSYASVESPGTTNIRVVNQSASPIEIETGCDSPFHLLLEGEAVPPLVADVWTCAATQQGIVPGPDCFPSWAEVAPGGQLLQAWARTYYVKVDMPLDCVPAEAQSSYDGCYVSRPIPSGGLEMEVHFRRCVNGDCSYEKARAAFEPDQASIDLLVQ